MTDFRVTRNRAFAYSDIHGKAEELVETVAEYADTVWDVGDIAALAASLTERAFRVLHNDVQDFDRS